MKHNIFIKSLVEGKNCPVCQSPLLTEDRIKNALDKKGNVIPEQKNILKVPENSAICSRCGLKIEIKIGEVKKGGKK